MFAARAVFAAGAAAHFRMRSPAGERLPGGGQPHCAPRAGHQRHREPEVDEHAALRALAARAGLEVWGLAGVGLGDAALQDKAGKVETDLLMWLAAGGVRQQVATWAWKAGADGCGSTK